MEAGFKEEDHMQPVLIDLIKAAMGAVQCDCYLQETHSARNQLEDPISRPVCTLVAAGSMAMWTQVVSVWDFKIGSSKTETEIMYGQQIERCRYVLDSYDQRQLAVAVNVTMNGLEVMTVERQEQEDFKLSTTGPLPFSISDDSPGFQLFVNLLSTAKADLGFVTAHLPNISQLDGHRFTVQLLRKKGTAQQGSGSWVFSVGLESGVDAILKLNSSPNEVSQLPPTILASARSPALFSSAHALAGCAIFSLCVSHVINCHGLVLFQRLVDCCLYCFTWYGCWVSFSMHILCVHAGHSDVSIERHSSLGGGAGHRNL